MRRALAFSPPLLGPPSGVDGDDAATSWADAEAGRQPVGPHLGVIHHAVAVGVDQTLDGAELFLLGSAHGVLIGGDAPYDTVKLSGLVQLLNVELALDIVAVQFADKEIAMRVPADAGGLADERLGGYQFQTEAGREVHEFGTLGGGERLWCIGRF